MPEWKATLPHTWRLEGLPDTPESLGITYEFHIGHLDYIVPEGRREIYLTIPELPARDAEGRPRHPEQERWIQKVLASEKIRAQDIWWSHWQFGSAEDALAFERHLKAAGATRKADK